ncbi:MAG TPA: alpha/beta family hydrolase [Candidatus Dormibacteraeota bacterium]|nr:alpha/beta family hydrolase [Candidatus Dormibacteraeota bacterium]
MANQSHRTLFIDGPAGRLEAILWKPPASTHGPLLAAILCHPHPLFGGTMHNKVVYQVNKTFDRLGIAVLRFNFRGVGLSDGSHARGIGERDDVRAALDFLAHEFSGTPLLLAGFSFGSWVGMRVGCEDARVSELIGIGAPANNSDFSYLQDCAKPKLFVQGSQDPYGSPDRLNDLVRSIPGSNELKIVEGAEHFFVGKLGELDDALADWLIARHPQLTSRE